MEFIKYFEPVEYHKKENIDFIEAKINNDEFINYYILYKLFKTNRFNSLNKIYEFKKDKTKLKAYILQHYINKYEEYKIKNEKIEKYDAFLNIIDLDKKIEGIEEYVKLFQPKNKDRYIELIKTRKELKSAVSDMDSLIKEMLELRNNLKNKLIEYKKQGDYDASCPYCGFIWETYEEMSKSFKEKEKKFKESLKGQTIKLVEVEEELEKDFINPITQEIYQYKENHKKVDEKLVELLAELQEKEFDFSILAEYKSSELVWNTLGDYEELEISLGKLKESIEKNMEISSKLFEKMQKIYVRSFDEDIKEIKMIVSKKEFDELAFDDINKQKTLKDLNDQSNNVKRILKESKADYIFENNKVEDPEDFYERYFQLKRENFKKINQRTLEKKAAYINYMFSQNQSKVLNLYKSRKKRLDNIIDKMTETRGSIDETIKNHKREMANNIKIPFYIYTAKILQNYQQGMGIFLSTNSTSDAIRFITDKSSDHDAIHHLSSGQLAVTSIAFVLAVNKTYNISNNLKFLVIDDPIQEMDSMNIHSFVELIRHEFLNDYQIIFSTHNDNNALFMKYKFEKMDSKEVSLIDVQSKFFY